MTDSPRESSTRLLRPRLPYPLRPVVFTGHPAAAFLDAMTLVCLAAVGGMVFGLLDEALYGDHPLRRFLTELTPVLLLLLGTAGDVFFAASPGKWFLGMSIRAASGAPAPPWRLGLRWSMKYAPALLVVAAFLSRNVAYHLASPTNPLGRSPFRVFATLEEGLATIWAWCVVAGTLFALLPTRRTLHDWIAGTAVFDAASLVRHAVPARRGFEVAPVAVSPITAAVPVDADSIDASSDSPADATADAPHVISPAPPRA
jgi:uncharacterized RDD family membrane protein YckC